MKMSNSIAYLTCILLVFFVLKSAQAQNMEGMSPQPPITEVQPLPGPIITNQGIVIPLENLNPFQDSTLDNTTLGKRIEQRNNIELNESRGNKPGIGEREVRERTNQTQIAGESTSNFISPSASRGTPIYVWRDKKGVKHFTNLIKSIPPEYRERATKISEEE